jgi:hypothetical protein
MVPSNGQNEPTSSDEKGRSTAEIGGFLAFWEIRSMIRVWGSASIVLRCPAIDLCPLHSLLLSLSLSLCCLWSLWLSSCLLRLHHDGIHGGRPCRWARAIEAQRTALCSSSFLSLLCESLLCFYSDDGSWPWNLSLDFRFLISAWVFWHCHSLIVRESSWISLLLDVRMLFLGLLGF